MNEDGANPTRRTRTDFLWQLGLVVALLLVVLIIKLTYTPSDSISDDSTSVNVANRVLTNLDQFCSGAEEKYPSWFDLEHVQYNQRKLIGKVNYLAAKLPAKEVRSRQDPLIIGFIARDNTRLRFICLLSDGRIVEMTRGAVRDAIGDLNRFRSDHGLPTLNAETELNTSSPIILGR